MNREIRSNPLIAKMSMHSIGLGSQKSIINFYIANRPPVDDYPRLQELRGLAMHRSLVLKMTYMELYTFRIVSWAINSKSMGSEG